jgi:hypothetical protein
MLKEYGWNHAMSLVMKLLIDAGLSLALFAKHNSSPHAVFLKIEKRDDGLYSLKSKLFLIILEFEAGKPKPKTQPQTSCKNYAAGQG